MRKRKDGDSVRQISCKINNVDSKTVCDNNAMYYYGHVIANGIVSRAIQIIGLDQRTSSTSTVTGTRKTLIVCVVSIMMSRGFLISLQIVHPSTMQPSICIAYQRINHHGQITLEEPKEEKGVLQRAQNPCIIKSIHACWCRRSRIVILNPLPDSKQVVSLGLGI